MLAVLAAHPLFAAVLDSCESPAGWVAKPSDGVSLAFGSAPGVQGHSLALDFDFHGGSGWAVAHKAFPLDLPENYEFTFWIRGEAPVNNLEIKLIDPSGDNVWWVNRRNFAFPSGWQKIRLKKRHFEFAWGPAGGGTMRRMAALEIAVTAGTGGKGKVFLDELSFTPLPPEHPYTLTPTISASPYAWTADFGEPRGYGGLSLTWDGRAFAADYDVQISDDGAAWQTVRRVRGGNGGRDDLALPETESRYLRLLPGKGRREKGFDAIQVEVQPLAFGASLNDFFTAIARHAPRGAYPRAYSGEQSYWTVVGVDADTAEGLLSEDGALEVGKGAFSIEPFLYSGGRLLGWSEAVTAHSLENGYLPIPTVIRRHGDLSLAITAFADGPAGRSHLLARYRVRNEGKTATTMRLFLALRPFQVNPPWQFLNQPGGVAEIGRVGFDGKRVTADGRIVVPLTWPAASGAATFDQGDVTDFLRQGKLPPHPRVRDPFRHASAALAFDLTVPPGGSREVVVAVPLHAGAPVPAASRALFDRRLAAVRRSWEEKLGRVELALPSAARDLGNTVKTALAHILINRDGPAIQPGSRSYERSWIRDGALTSAALLRLGHEEDVRRFLVWYAGYLFDNGKVPCCVDARGADPVPENDSGGEFLYLAAEYLRVTGDRETVRALWPKIEKAVAYLDELRGQRRTPEYETPEKRRFYGLLPESISHEGYSSHPEHSFWDDFWALRGYKDAVEIAAALGQPAAAARFAAARDQFRHDLYAALAATLALHKIDYLPGSVELGDFDPTSSTILLAPGGELTNLPQRELHQTFERYHENFVKRRDGTLAWENYTPYELRTVGSFIRLGWRDRAWELLDFFLKDRRPAGWNQWAEVVWKDPRTPKFVGDIPHTWVASDFLRSFLDAFAYERENDRTLVLAGGIPKSWVESPAGVAIRHLRTPYGKLDLSLHAEGNAWKIRIGGGIRIPPGGLVLRGPWPAAIERAEAGGRSLPVSAEGEITVRAVPVEVGVWFRQR